MLKPLLLAIQTLTVLPLARRMEFQEQELSRSVLFFPLAGALIGSAGAAFFYYGTVFHICYGPH